MSNYLREITAVVRSSQSSEELIAKHDADALFEKFLCEADAQVLGKSARSVWRRAVADAILKPDRPATKTFNGLYFDAVPNPKQAIFTLSNVVSTYQSDVLTDKPHLEIHFGPKRVHGLRQQLREASTWLAQPKIHERYPVIIGCTYAELGKVATRFGFTEATLGWVDPQYEYMVGASHDVFLALNRKPADTPTQLVALAADTEILAGQWAVL